MFTIQLGEAIPVATPHAISVSLPSWKDNVGYEENDHRVMTKLTTGYPRFFIHKIIVTFAEAIVRKYGDQEAQQAMLFPSQRAAQRCIKFILSRNKTISKNNLSVIDLALDPEKNYSTTLKCISPFISAVLLPSEDFSLAKQYWQHTGDGVSSRKAEFCYHLFQEDILINKSILENYNYRNEKVCKGPRRYQKEHFPSPTAILSSVQRTVEHQRTTFASYTNTEFHESSQFLEERFGRNLDVSLFKHANLAIRRRIAGSLSGEELYLKENTNIDSNIRRVVGLTENDVYLWPCGANSIFQIHQMLMEARGAMKSICFGFPYVDTLKILEKFGPGCSFYGNGSSEDLDDLERKLKVGEKYLAIFCELPSNPLLKSPDLLRISELASTYDFAIVVDETIGNFINVNVLPFADVVVSSLSKIFSGECNVTGGSSILNPNSRYYNRLKTILKRDYEDTYWAEDVIFMERNSRDFVERIERINVNAEAICQVLEAHPLVTDIYYPKYSSTKKNYDFCRTPNGKYGGLLSFRFQKLQQAIVFFDHIEMAKGPSLGTNFTLISPYVILAHFRELEWAAQFGVPADLIRVSVGLEEEVEVVKRFKDALNFVSEIES